MGYQIGVALDDVASYPDETYPNAKTKLETFTSAIFGKFAEHWGDRYSGVYDLPGVHEDEVLDDPESNAGVKKSREILREVAAGSPRLLAPVWTLRDAAEKGQNNPGDGIHAGPFAMQAKGATIGHSAMGSAVGADRTVILSTTDEAVYDATTPGPGQLLVLYPAA